jgi:hypothetical protein
MPLALFLLIVLYVWLVWKRTKGDAGKALTGEDARKAEKLMGIVRVGLVLASVVLVAAIIMASTPPGTAPDHARVGGVAGALRSAGGFFGVDTRAAALPFFVIIGTAISYGYTIVAAAKVVGFHRAMKRR